MPTDGGFDGPFTIRRRTRAYNEPFRTAPAAEKRAKAKAARQARRRSR